jgi:hypothetical protein
MAESKPCDHGVTPWWDCEECAKKSRGGWHFSHGPQWTPRKEQLSAERARNPFGKLSNE